MCLIFLKPKTAKNYLTKERFNNALTNNPHAVGIVYRNNGKVEIQRFVKPSANKDEIYDIIKDKEEFAVHFRYATHGILNLTNTHPFIVTKGLCMMHNGVMSEFGDLNKDWSDTKNFVEYFLKPYVEEEGISVVQNPEFKADLEKVIGSGNKLLFIDENFNYSIINEKAGTWREGCWLSNTYSVEPPYSSYYSTYAPKDGTAGKSLTKPYDYWNDYRSYDDYDEFGWEYPIKSKGKYKDINELENVIADEIQSGAIMGEEIPYELEMDEIATSKLSDENWLKALDEIAESIRNGVYSGNSPCQWQLIIKQEDIDDLIGTNDATRFNTSTTKKFNLTEEEKVAANYILDQGAIFENEVEPEEVNLLNNLISKGVVKKVTDVDKKENKSYTFYTITDEYENYIYKKSNIF